jgi:2,3-bisphosphoglycerate-independent phosphoglycerate mutase
MADGVDKLIEGGGLNNISPTVLKVMGVKIPKEMDTSLY